MNYQKHYTKLIETRQLLNRSKSNDGLLEAHHILPKSLGGSNDKSNLILLTPKEHYIAHWLLFKMHVGKNKAKMAYAFFKMCCNNKNQQRVFNSCLYVYKKKIISENCKGENHHSYGINPFSEEYLNTLSENMTGNKNPQYGKIPWNFGLSKNTSDIIFKYSEKFKQNYVKENHPHYGKTRSDDTKNKISLGLMNKPKSEEHKIKLSEANTGKKLSIHTKEKMSAARKGKSQTKLQCPHCSKIGGTTMYRWHFDNCKFK